MPSPITSRTNGGFSRGVDDARSGLRWVSSRRTARTEDIAYPHFGIFGLHLPFLYGESVGKALGRLLAEIMSQSEDISVLDWVGGCPPFNPCFPAYITSYRTLPLPPPQPHAEEQSSTTSEQLTSSVALQKFTRQIVPPTIRQSSPYTSTHHPSCRLAVRFISIAPFDIHLCK